MSTPAADATRTPSETAAPLSVYRNPRVWLLVALGLSSGLPLALVGHSLTAWMTDEGVDLKTVGFFTAVMTPYALKFLWAPLFDWVRLPLLSRLGRRLGFAFLFQVLILLGLVGLSFLNPQTAPAAFASAALFIAVASASQDVVVDAYRTDTLAPAERAAGTATFVTGYRLGMLLSGALAMGLADAIGWAATYRVMGGFVLIGMVAVVLAREPDVDLAPRSLGAAIAEPFRAFFVRHGLGAGAMVLVFLVLFKIGDAFAGALTTRFFKELGYSNTTLGALQSGVGLVATIAGGFLAGALLPRLGLRVALVAFGLCQAFTNVGFIVVAFVGQSIPVLIAAVVVDNVASGLGTAAFVALLMGLCEQRYSATQYALLSALSSVGARFLGAFSGVVAVSLGWPWFFAFTIAVAIPGVVMAALLPRRLTDDET